MFNKKKGLKLFVLTVTAMMVFTVGPNFASAYSVSFTDVDESSDHYDNIMGLAEGNVFLNHGGKFNPYNPITRGQVSAAMSRALMLDHPNDPTYPAYYFEDVSFDNSFLNEIATVMYFEIFNGMEINGKMYFKTYEPISRQQMASVIVNAFGFDESKLIDGSTNPVTDPMISASHRENVQILADFGITTQTEDFDAYSNIQRDQFASFLQRAFDIAMSGDLTEK